MDEIRSGSGLVGSLNGTWDRARRLFRMQYGGDVPKGITPVWIAGDAREPMGQVGAYRRFVASWQVLVPAGSALKVRPSLDSVITSLRYTWSAGTPSVRLASVAETQALNPTGWTQLTAANGSWADTPDGSLVPLDVQTTAGTTGNTAITASITGTFLPDLSNLFLPAGASVQFYAPGAGTTFSIVLQGYVRVS